MLPNPPAATRGRFLSLMFLLALAGFCSPSAAKDKPPTVRWAEGQPGCTFEKDRDGKYRWGTWWRDIAVLLTVDSQETQKTRRRPGDAFAVQLTVRYRGSGELEVRPGKVTLEFVEHSHVERSALDPDAFSDNLAAWSQALAEETDREVRKHPEKQDQQVALLRARTSDAHDLEEFLEKSSLRKAKLNSTVPEAGGWLFFSAQSRWIGKWKQPEVFVLRVPLGEEVFEFPFSLPPENSGPTLRQRPEH